MRSTFTLDDQVDQQVRAIAAQQHRSYKDVLNEALRRGVMLIAENPPEGAFQVEPLVSGFKPGIDTGKLNQVADELESGA